MPLKLFAYALVRYVPDVVRGEAVNLGVVVVSEEEGRSASRFLNQFKQRIGLLDPNADVEFVQGVLASIAARFTAAYQPQLGAGENEAIMSESGLAHLAGTLCNQIQLSQPARYRGKSLDEVAGHLFETLVAPVVKRQALTEPHMTVGRIRELIKDAIKQWSSDAMQVEVEEATTERAGGAKHYADFWLKVGSPTAALIAIPDDPEEYHVAWTRRDSLPTVAAEFRQINPHFKAVAVFPQRISRDMEFISETKSFLGSVEGVIVTSVEELPGLREELIPQLV